MSSKQGPLGIRIDDSYRSIPEARIVRSILLAGSAYDVDSDVAADEAQGVLGRWVELGLGFRRTASGERLFDPVEVGNFLKRVGLDGRDGFLSEKFVPNHRRMVRELAEPDSSAGVPGNERQFVVDLKRTFNLHSFPKGTKLRLRAPLPIGGSYLRKIEVNPYAVSSGETQIHVSPGRLELRIVTKGEAEVSAGVSVNFTVRLQEPSPGDAEGETDRELYLNEREGLIVVTERIRSLAKSLAGTDAPVPEAVRAFWVYIYENLIFGSVHYDEIDPAAPCDWILDAGWFDCHLGASLFTALCRANGIAARVVSGYLLYRVAPLKHYWAEVWIEDQGWTPFDFIGWDLSASDHDPAWRDRFYGRVDYRLMCERMPREFTGAIGLPLPPAWCFHSTPQQGGVEGCFMAIDGTMIYADLIRVTKWF